MALPSQSLQVYGGGRSKRARRRKPVDDRASKRRKYAPCDGRSATRPLTSGERLSGASSTSSLYCGEMDKGIFGISFERTANDGDAASQYQATQLSTAENLKNLKNLKRYGDAKLYGIKALFEQFGMWPWERGQGWNLQLRYGYIKSLVATDGVFRNSSTGSVGLFIDFARQQDRKNTHIITLIRKAKRENHPTGRIAEEMRRIKPKIAEEDAQIALIIAAMAQEMFRNGEPDQSGVWVRVIGIRKTEVFFYRAFVPKTFVQTFDASEGFVIQYRSASLNDQNTVLQELDRLLREKRPRRGQAVVTEQAKC